MWAGFSSLMAASLHVHLPNAVLSRYAVFCRTCSLGSYLCVFPEAQILNRNRQRWNSFGFFHSVLFLKTWTCGHGNECSYFILIFIFFQKKETLSRVWVTRYYIRSKWCLLASSFFFHILTSNLWDRYISICTLLKYISLHERVEKMCCTRFDSWLREPAEDERKKCKIIFYTIGIITALTFRF